MIEIDGWQYHWPGGRIRRRSLKLLPARGRRLAPSWPLAATAIEDEPDEFVSLVTAALQSRR